MRVNQQDIIDKNNLMDYVKASRGNIVLGIDGIRDQVWRVVETRLNKDECLTIDTVKKYGEYILNRGSGGMAIELLSKRMGYGGFTANTGFALGAMGYNPVLLGMYGTNVIDKVFEPLEKICELNSLGEPAVCQVLEFDDGKIMMPYLNEILNFSWKELESALGLERIKEIFRDADIFALGYWSNLFAFDDLLERICRDILPETRVGRIFHDFANIKKRSEDDLKRSLKHMAELNTIVPMTLSLNEHEGELLLKCYGKDTAVEKDKVLDGLIALREEIGIDEILIHTPYFAAGASANSGNSVVPQQYCENPVRTAGAGDTFNGAYIAASVEGDVKLNLSERLEMGNAATLFFVTNGVPPKKEDLIEFFSKD